MRTTFAFFGIAFAIEAASGAASPPPSDAGPGPNLTYTGNVKLEQSAPDAGLNVASFMRVFLE